MEINENNYLKKLIVLSLIFVGVGAFVVTQYIPSYNEAVGQAVTNDVDDLLDLVLGSEVQPIVEMSEKYTVFDNEDGTVTGRFSMAPMNYKTDSGFAPIDTTFEIATTAPGFIAEKANHKVFVNNTFDANRFLIIRNRFKGQAIDVEFKPYAVAWVKKTDLSNPIVVGTPQKVTGVASSSVVRFDDAFGKGLHYEVTMTKSGVIKELIVDNKAALEPIPRGNYQLAILFEASTTADVKREKDAVSKWDGLAYLENDEFFIEKANGDALFMPKPRIQDATGRTFPAKMFWGRANGRTLQAKIITKQTLSEVTAPIRTDTVIDTYDGTNSKQVVSDARSGNYNTEANAATGNNVYTLSSTGIHNVVHDSLSGGSVYIRRADLQFDTSTIGSGQTISAASLNIHSLTAGVDTDGYTLYVLDNTNNAGLTDPIVAEDYNDFENDSANAVGSITFAALDASNGVKTVTINSFGLIDPIGTTRVGLRSGNDMLEDLDGSASDPTSWNYYRGDYGSGGDAPYLDVTWAPASAAADPEVYVTPIF